MTVDALLGEIFLTVLSKKSLRRKCSKVIIITIKICSASYYNLLLLNWYLFGVEMNLGDSHKTRFWYLLEVFSKFSDEHPRHFIRGVPPPPLPPGHTLLLRLKSAFFATFFT